MHYKETFTLESIQAVAKNFLKALAKPGGGRIANILAFYGKMGAGKTTFIKALCNELGVTDNVTSPTFAIVNEYQGTETIYHFDFYRIKRTEEFYDMGGEEYFYSGNLCLIEWPELIEGLLPDDTLAVTILEEADGTRTIEVKTQAANF